MKVLKEREGLQLNQYDVCFQGLEKLGIDQYGISKKEMEEGFQFLDQGGDGFVQVDEFEKFMKNEDMKPELLKLQSAIIDIISRSDVDDHLATVLFTYC